MNTISPFSTNLASFFHLCSPLLGVQQMASISHHQINFLSMIQREQQRLQALKQLQTLYTPQYLQNTANKYYNNHFPSSISPNSEIMSPNSITIKDNYLNLKIKSSQSEFNTCIALRNQDVILQLKIQISNMLDFFIDKFEKVSLHEIAQQRSFYSFNPSLQILFDKLVKKYESSRKSREDMIRSVVRRALKFLKDSYKAKFNLTSRAASMKICKTYFNQEEMKLNQIDFEDENQVLSFLLPYRKDSRNKTPNTRFITEIFASEEFCHDYMGYLETYDLAFEKDNNHKIAKFCDFLVKCVEHNTIDQVQNYKRLPWLKTWQETTKVIAFELLDKRHLKNFNQKQIKS